MPRYFRPLEQTAGNLPDPNVTFHGAEQDEKRIQARLNSYFSVSKPIPSLPPLSPEVIDVDFEPPINTRSLTPADASPYTSTSNPTTVSPSPPERPTAQLGSEILSTNPSVPNSSHAITSNHAPPSSCQAPGESLLILIYKPSHP